MTKMTTRSATKRLREPEPEPKAKVAVEKYKLNAEWELCNHSVVPRRILVTFTGSTVKYVTVRLDASRKAATKEHAILAMQDHAIRFQDYRQGLRFVKLLQVKQLRLGVTYTVMIFVGACDMVGETVYKAILHDDRQVRKVHHAWTLTPKPKGECKKAGKLCIPKISITRVIASSSNVGPSEIPAIGGDEDKLVFDDTTKEATLIDCAILAMQDHAIQNNYSEGLHFIKLLTYQTTFAKGYFYSITFRGACTKYPDVIYEATVYEGAAERKVGRVRTISPPNRWYYGTLCVPKVACKPE